MSSISRSPVTNFTNPAPEPFSPNSSTQWRKRASTPQALATTEREDRSSIPHSPSVQKLSTVTDRLSSFHTSVESEVTQRRVEEEQRLQLIRDAVTHLDKVLQVETKRRQESFKTLQMMFEHQLSTIQSRLTDDIREASEELSMRVDQVANKCDDIEKQLNDERQTREQENEDSIEAAISQVNAVQAALDVEKVARLEREAAILKRVSDDSYRLQEKIESERVGREGTVATIRDEMESLDRQRQRFAERQQAALLEEMADLKERLDMEVAGRENAEAQICVTIDDVVHRLQGGIHMMAK